MSGPDSCSPPDTRVFPDPFCGRKSRCDPRAGARMPAQAFARRAQVGPVDCPSHASRVWFQAKARPRVLRQRLPGERPVRHLRVQADRARRRTCRRRSRARVDVAVLDMNHGWPNLGHDSLVHAVLDAACEATGRARGGRDARARALVRRAPLGHAAGAPGPPLLALSRHRRAGAPRPARATTACARNRRASARTPRGSSPPSRCSTRSGATSRRRSSPCATPSACCAAGRARPRPCCAGRRRASAAASSRTSWRCRRPSTPGSAASPSSCGPSARLRVVENRLFDLIPRPDGFPPGAVPIALRDPGRGRRARRRGHDDRVRARRGRRDAAHVRGEPPPRDRRPLPPGDDPRPEARPRRGERTRGTASASRS